MGTTAGGLPYPEPSDPIAQGAAAIRALAEAVELDQPRSDQPTVTFSGTTSGTTPLVAATLNIAQPARAGRLHVWVTIGFTKTVATDRFNVVVKIDGVAVGDDAEDGGDSTNNVRRQPNGSAAVDTVGAVAVTVELTRLSGTGTATALLGYINWIMI